jgi:hypothetical protein
LTRLGVANRSLEARKEARRCDRNSEFKDRGTTVSFLQSFTEVRGILALTDGGGIPYNVCKLGGQLAFITLKCRLKDFDVHPVTAGKIDRQLDARTAVLGLRRSEASEMARIPGRVSTMIGKRCEEQELAEGSHGSFREFS